MDISTIFSNMETTDCVSKLLLDPYQIKVSSRLGQAKDDSLKQALDLTFEEAHA